MRGVYARRLCRLAVGGGEPERYLFRVSTSPASFVDILALVQRAHCVTWFRDSGFLNIFIDDLPADRRTVVVVRVNRLSVEVRQLHGYDRKRDRWTDYVGGPRLAKLDGKRGLKALMQWIEARAMECHRCPNPPVVAYFRRTAAA